jgi:Zn-dependent protease
MWLLNGSVSLGVWFGINVRVHAMLILLAVLNIVFPGQLGGFSMSVETTAILFGIVLLHEFGHCYGSYLVGGRPYQIIMHPLGGLASADAPRRPWPTFITVLAGPMVNVIICLITALLMRILVGSWDVLPWNPMGILYYLARMGGSYGAVRHLFVIFSVSYGILMFNLLPIFPFDGGQLLQSLLWVKFGYYRATVFATITGMIGGVMLFVWGLMNRSLLLVLIAVSGFQTCFYMYKELKANGPWAYQDEDNTYAAASLSYASVENARNKGQQKKNARAAKRAEKIEREANEEQEQIDTILAKVSAQGMNSLTWLEKRALHKATERQRARDAEMSRGRRRN